MRVLACLMLLGMPRVLFADEIVHRFQAGDYHEKLFSYEGIAKEFAKPETGGLVWRYGEGKAPTAPQGVCWNCRVKGDFIASASYEILVAKGPPEGGGVGVEFFLVLANRAKDGIAFARWRHPRDGDQVFFGHRYFENGTRTSKASLRFPAPPNTQRGRLRFERVGAELTASIAAADEPNFTTIHKGAIDTDDVEVIRFAGVSGANSDAELVARLSEYRLEGKDVQRIDAPGAGIRENRSLILCLIVGFAVALGGFAVFWRRGRPR
jgi:hypothetical protein